MYERPCRAKEAGMIGGICKPTDHRTADSYLTNKGTTINHFYEKLLLLEDRMNTATGKAIGEKRHQFMEDYLRRFYEEWEGG
jgi:uncharacterized protein